MPDTFFSDILGGIAKDPNVILDAKLEEWSCICGCSDPDARRRAARLIKGAREDALQPVDVMHGTDIANAAGVFRKGTACGGDC